MGFNYNTNSTKYTQNIYITNQQNAGTGMNTGIMIENASTELDTAGNNLNVDGAAIGIRHS